jgi:hypothetical protein
MFRLFSKSLTERTHHYIDWSRIGNLVASGNHRYGAQELLVRASIIACIATSAYVAAHFNNEEKTGCSTLVAAIAGGAFGFVASHTVVIYPLVKKRCDMSKECKQLVAEIEEKIHSLPSSEQNFKVMIDAVLEKIQVMSLSDDVHAKASQTWGKRKTLLLMVCEKLNAYDSKDWQGNVDTITATLLKDSGHNLVHGAQRLRR